MNIYVIYKFDDYDEIAKIVNQIKEEIPDGNSIFMFEKDRSRKLWRFHAAKKLKDSQLVILFDSLSDEKQPVGKNILWELKKAEKLKKRIVIFKANPELKNRSWYGYDYSEKDPLQSRYTTKHLSEAVNFMKQECSWQINKHLIKRDENETALSEADKTLLLEQYRIMIETSEKLMERRQATVNLYTTLCTTLIAFIGASFAFNNINMFAIISWLSGLVLIVLCHNWSISLDTYDLNNSGKFQVINELEKKLPAEIFECEYRCNKRNGMRSFSSREKVLPKIFSILGILLMILATVLLAIALLNNAGII